jgi:hypothetical protein
LDEKTKVLKTELDGVPLQTTGSFGENLGMVKYLAPHISVAGQW